MSRQQPDKGEGARRISKGSSPNRSKRLRRQSLRGRYTSFAVIVGGFALAIAFWAQYEVEWASSQSGQRIQARNQAQQLNGRLSNALWEANQAVQTFALSPGLVQQGHLRRTLANAQTQAEALAAIPWIRQSEFAKSSEQLRERLWQLGTELESLMDLRAGRAPPTAGTPEHERADGHWHAEVTHAHGRIQPLLAASWKSLGSLRDALETSSGMDVAVFSDVAVRISATLWGLVALTLLFVALGYGLLKRTVLIPIGQLGQALRTEAKGAERPTPPSSKYTEIEQLVQAFNQMHQRVQERQRALQHQAVHDALTGLPNRVLLQDRLQQGLLKARRSGGSIGLMIMDLNHFKEINDTLGHRAGDHLLQRASQRFLTAIRGSDTVARLGGDEFAVLLEPADRQAAEQSAARLIKVFEREFEVDGHKLYVGASIGIALYPQHGSDVSTLVRHADVAMYQAKRSNGGHAFYDEAHDDHSVARLAFVKDLRRAIASDELYLCYQPKVDFATGRVCGVEALLRWNHPEHGPVSPLQIISIAERTALIRPLTEWVLKTAVTQCARWRKASLDLDVAINLSVWSLQDPNFSGRVAKILATCKVPPAALVLEITESAMMADPERAMESLTQLNQHGIRMAVDDFGTGFSSLSYLKKLPVHELKIDQSFVKNMHQSINDEVIVRSTVDLGHNLGLHVVAEGIECQTVWDRLSELGCDQAQGHYICRPLRGDEATLWLRRAVKNQPHLGALSLAPS